MKILEHLFSFLAPHDCMVCGSEGGLLCEVCRDKTLPYPGSRCYKCLKSSDKSRTCKECRNDTVLSHVWVVTDYKSTAKKLVRLLKYSNTREAARVMAVSIYAILPSLPKDTVIVPISALNRHIRMRSYDQAVLIAKELSKLTNLPCVEGLTRQGRAQQVGSGREQRLSQLAGAFRIRRPASIQGSRILLVDDVLTTGATLDNAATLVMAGGARAVAGVVFAH